MLDLDALVSRQIELGLDLNVGLVAEVGAGSELDLLVVRCTEKAKTLLLDDLGEGLCEQLLLDVFVHLLAVALLQKTARHATASESGQGDGLDQLVVGFVETLVDLVGSDPRDDASLARSEIVDVRDSTEGVVCLRVRPVLLEGVLILLGLLAFGELLARWLLRLGLILDLGRFGGEVFVFGGGIRLVAFRLDVHRSDTCPRPVKELTRSNLPVLSVRAVCSRNSDTR